MNKIKTLSLLAALISTPLYADNYVINVNGMVCEFCAIGVTKKVSQLSFIDQSKHTSGVSVDIKEQRVTIAVKDDSNVDKDKLFEAIESGGYNPVSIWQIMPSGEQIPL